MRAITLTQPWATLVAIGAKRIETRSWRTSYRGPLAIHAAAGLGPVDGLRGLQRLCVQAPFHRVLEPHYRVIHANIDGLGLIDCIDVEALPRGVVVATCTLTAIYPATNSGYAGEDWVQVPDAEYAFGDYRMGRYAWLLDDVQPLPEPIPARGQPGLWEWAE